MLSQRKVDWQPQARDDLESIADYIATDSYERAIEIVARLNTKAQTLVELTERGRVVPEMLELGKRDYRELVVSPWRLIYRLEGTDRVTVCAVLDARRDLGQLLLDRLLD